MGTEQRGVNVRLRRARLPNNWRCQSLSQSNTQKNSELGADGLKKYEKMSFTILTPEVEEELQSIPDLRSIVLCGIETQACNMPGHRFIGLSQMRQSGALLTTSEGVLLQLLGDAKHPKFKEVQKIIMEPAPDSDLLSLFRCPNLFSTECSSNVFAISPLLESNLDLMRSKPNCLGNLWPSRPLQLLEGCRKSSIHNTGYWVLRARFQRQI
ncbi:isochorismatase domain-containing protein 2-like isoform X2 [Xenopus laevis]|uniref:Isochorismatase domain-containing protein 2-like isoform X2 n=1 Tax=Xenopus laevis TaxID=8355 RepID=A0A8J0TBM2_XENLA|nr:isochorismatase domain-containing protein 2-like isoform X2 [Xenopus laevis]